MFIGLIGLGVYASSASGTVRQANVTIEEIQEIGQTAHYQITDNDCEISFRVTKPENGDKMPPSISSIPLSIAGKLPQTCRETVYGDQTGKGDIAVYRKIDEQSRSITFWVFIMNVTIPASRTFLYG